MFFEKYSISILVAGLRCGGDFDLLATPRVAFFNILEGLRWKKCVYTPYVFANVTIDTSINKNSKSQIV